ncbi:uncharacterized protein LOC131644459 [Vicia villosa]|uniref:uncharacterized protein LOC131644459 n=1 Tax=Vicia villosa TaxID=3911 RepID=UPI00273CBB92|nr:uncharacterized protein LOC131644459 [Vicia villosa]XP_058770953.1 uncharacterized protein LOC131644459 [Vicia villosa]
MESMKSIGMARSLEEVVELIDVRIMYMDDNFEEFEWLESSNVEEVIGDVAARKTWCLWKIEVNDPKIMEKIVLQLPQSVIKTCDLIGNSCIELVDSAIGDSCLCDLHTSMK